MSNDNHFRAYEQASKYVLRELSLINNRLTWILTIHGFLYATYGFTLQKQIEIIEKLTDSISTAAAANPPIKFNASSVCLSLYQTKYFSEAIAGVGVSISIAGIISIAAACTAMRSVSKTFEKNLSRPIEESENPKFYIIDSMKFPHLLGGGGGKKLPVDIVGDASSLIIPFVLFLSWLTAFACIYWYGGPSIQSICQT